MDRNGTENGQFDILYFQLRENEIIHHSYHAEDKEEKENAQVTEV